MPGNAANSQVVFSQIEDTGSSGGAGWQAGNPPLLNS